MAECPFASSPPSQAASPTGGQAPSGTALEASDPLLALNDAFREAYAARRDAALAHMGPVIAQLDDVLVLRHRGQRLEGPARTRRYHELKALNHLPLALFVLLADARGPLDDTVRGRLETLRALITTTLEGLERRGFGAGSLARQRRLLEASRTLLERVRAGGRVDAGALSAFSRAQVPDLLRNAEDAARDQIDTMHATVEAWKQRMTPEEREQLCAVVAVSHMSRPGNVAMQYFSVTLGDSWEGRFDQEALHPDKRVLAAEAGFEEQQAFELLGMHALDTYVGERFFGEEMRLERDILADPAERILARMFHKEPEAPAPDAPTGRPGEQG